MPGEKRTLLKHARIKQNGLDAQSTFPSGHNPINSIRTNVLMTNVHSEYRPDVITQRRAIGKAVIAIIALTVIIIVGAISVIALTSPTTTGTIIAIGTCTLGEWASAGPQNQSASNFYVQVNYAGQWSSKIQGFSSLKESLGALTVNQCIPSSSGNATFVIPNWNPTGESYLCAWANKFDSSDGTLTVSVSNGAAIQSNSASAPYGSATACLGVVP